MHYERSLVFLIQKISVPLNDFAQCLQNFLQALRKILQALQISSPWVALFFVIGVWWSEVRIDMYASTLKCQRFGAVCAVLYPYYRKITYLCAV